MSDNEQPLNHEADIKCTYCCYTFTAQFNPSGDKCPECGTVNNSIEIKKLEKQKNIEFENREKELKKRKEEIKSRRLNKEKIEKDRRENEKIILEQRSKDDKKEREENENEKIKLEAATQEDFIEYVNSKKGEGIDYVSLNSGWRKKFEMIFSAILSTPLYDWSKFQREFYLKFRDYPGRKEYFDFLNADPSSPQADKKFEAIINEMKEIQKRLGRQIEAQEMSVKAAHANFLMDHMGE